MSEPIFRAACAVFALAAAVLAEGCSSSTTNAAGVNCSSFSACGGNVVGTWKLSTACVSGTTNPLASQCPSSTAQISESVGGSVTFNSDGTYSSNVSSTVVEDITVPSSCVNGAPCDQLQSAINMEGDGGAGSPMAACTTASGGCSCKVTLNGGSGPSNGTYSVSGSTLTLDGQPAAYCVQGNDLLLQQSIGAMGMAGSGTVTFAAVKQ